KVSSSAYATSRWSTRSINGSGRTTATSRSRATTAGSTSCAFTTRISPGSSPCSPACAPRRWWSSVIAAGSRLTGMPMPTLDGILETALYVDDMPRAQRFYEDVMALRRLFADQRLSAYEVAGRDVLLIFQRGASLQTAHLPGGTIPPHDGHGPVHVAFSIAADERQAWESRLDEAGVAIEGRTHWPRGGDSIYFRDPDGHLLELATPGLWAGY